MNDSFHFIPFFTRIPRYLLVICAVAAVAVTAFAETPAAFDVPAAEVPFGFEARLVSAGVKIFPDSVPAGPPGATMRLSAVRNEYAPFQVAVSALRGKGNFSIAFSQLADTKGTIAVPPRSLFLVENVLVKKPSIPTAGPGTKTDSRLWPDPLPPLTVFEVREGETRAVWIDLFVPASAEPGVYKGKVVVSSPGRANMELPVEVDVRAITLPTTPSLRTAFGNTALPSCLEKAHHVSTGTPEYRRLIEDYYWMLVEHRLSPYQIPVSIYSEEAHRFLDDPRVTSFVVPVGGGSDQSAGPGSIWDDTEMKRLSDRLERTGWIDKGLFYVIDEPKESAFPDVAKVGKRIHGINPRFQYLMTPASGKILAHQDVLAGASVDVWVPLLTVMSRRADRAILLDQQKTGRELWWYTCVVPKWKGMNYFIDEAATAPRLHPWMNYLYGNTGILYWATDNWTKVSCDPWSETETFPTGNGDGSLLYPGRDSAGPVASIRLKMLREGLEEYELLALLGRRLKEVALKIGGPALTYRPEERLFEHALSLVAEEGRAPGPGGEPAYLTHVTQDYREIEKRRDQVIHEIEGALDSPVFLVTSFPRDGEVTGREAAVVRGYAEEGTRIEVNSASVPVAEKVFETVVILVPGRNEVTVTATNREGRSKTMGRVIIRK